MIESEVRDEASAFQLSTSAEIDTAERKYARVSKLWTKVEELTFPMRRSARKSSARFMLP